MSRWFESRLLWGGLLILAGVLFLLENLGILQLSGSFWELFVGVGLGVGGLAFLLVYAGNREHWWALIPGFTLLGVASLIVLSSLLPQVAERVGGALVLGGIALAFLTVYFSDRRNWWAIIPGGVMLTLTLVVTLGELTSGWGTGALFFIGLGLTFALVALMPTPEGRMQWAWIPAAILLLMGGLILAAAEELIGIIGPVALIVGGLFLFYQAVRPRQQL